MSLHRRAFLATPALLGLAGCTAAELIGGSRPPPKLFELTPKSTFPPNLPAVKGVVRVEAATATAGLNTTRIALRPSPTALEYYANALWIDVLPVMVQNLFVESLENSNAIDAVGPAAAGVPARFGLLLHIREFQAEYAAPDRPPTARVRLQCRAVTLPRRDSVAATGAEAAVDATGTPLDAVIDAFDEALGKALREIVVWAAETLHAVEARG